MTEPRAYKGKLSDFKPDEHNLNQHTQRGRGMVENSQRLRGFGRPGFAAKDKTMLGGNLSIMDVAADIELGDGEVFVVETDGNIPIVHVRRDLDPGTEAATLLAAEDNQSALVSIDFDPEVFAAEIAAGVDFSGIFTEDEQAGILAELGQDEPPKNTEPQIDKTEELRQEWGTEVGQLWQLGDDHRLAVGDCTDRTVVERLMMGGERADVVFADPPYNVGSETLVFAKDAPTHYRSSKGIAKADWDKDFNVSKFLEILPFAIGDNCSIYICTSHHLISIIWDWMKSVSRFYSYCVWCKPNPSPSLSKRQWTWATELIAYAVIGKHTFNYPDGTHALNWWEITVPRHITDHPTEKPVAIPEQAIIRSSSNNDIVYDPFLGSGTTLIACQNLNRQCRGIEIDSGYAAVTLQRFCDLTDIKPELIT